MRTSDHLRIRSSLETAAFAKTGVANPHCGSDRNPRLSTCPFYEFQEKCSCGLTSSARGCVACCGNRNTLRRGRWGLRRANRSKGIIRRAMRIGREALPNASLAGGNLDGGKRRQRKEPQTDPLTNQRPTLFHQRLDNRPRYLNRQPESRPVLAPRQIC